MLTAMPRCDHCDALLRIGRVERDRKRFCCLECLRAFMDGDLRAISPHDHARRADRNSPDAGRTARPVGRSLARCAAGRRV
jgi:hypothetical protein